MRRIAAVLVHYPVLDREGQVVTTAITNLDLHDIARSAHTYGLSDFFVVHPVAAQRTLAERVCEHWTHGSGARRIPDRSPAMQLIRVVSTLDEALDALGSAPTIWTTSARPGKNLLTYEQARQQLAEVGSPIALLFGTGWGLAGEVYARATAQLEPIRSPRSDGYNHLSVRAAAAISFDRLLSPR